MVFRILLVFCMLFVRPQALAQTQESDGKAIYLDQCVNCHHYDGSGIYNIAYYSGRHPPDLSKLTVNNDGAFPEARVRAVLFGSQATPNHVLFEMPNFARSYLDLVREWRSFESDIDPFAEVSEQIDSIVAYLKTLQSNE